MASIMLRSHICTFSTCFIGLVCDRGKMVLYSLKNAYVNIEFSRVLYNKNKKKPCTCFIRDVSLLIIFLKIFG